MKAERDQKESKDIQLVRAGPSSEFHDLEIGLDSHTPGLKRAAGHKNELRRLTSLPKVITSGEFWESLPLMSKVFLVASCIDALLVIAFAIQQMASVSVLVQRKYTVGSCICCIAYAAILLPVAQHQKLFCAVQSTQGELLHISLVMLVTAIFFLWFAWDAIICENAFELIAAGVLGLAVCARIIYFVIRRSVSLLYPITKRCLQAHLKLCTSGTVLQWTVHTALGLTSQCTLPSQPAVSSVSLHEGHMPCPKPYDV